MYIAIYAACMQRGVRKHSNVGGHRGLIHMAKNNSYNHGEIIN